MPISTEITADTPRSDTATGSGSNPQDLYAKKKKLLRLADAQFLAGQNPDLPKLPYLFGRFLFQGIPIIL